MELSRDLRTLVNSDLFSDVTFEVEGHRICAHRALLAARSEYFRAMFCGGLKEASDMINNHQVNCTTFIVTVKWTSEWIQKIDLRTLYWAVENDLFHNFEILSITCHSYWSFTALSHRRRPHRGSGNFALAPASQPGQRWIFARVKFVINCKLFLSGRVFTTKNSPKSICSRGSTSEPTGGARDTPPDTLVGWWGDTSSPFPASPQLLRSLAHLYSAPVLICISRRLCTFPQQMIRLSWLTVSSR